MIREYLVTSKDHSRFIKASNDLVAAKRFLNYLRRYTQDRPTMVNTAENINGKIQMEDTLIWNVKWYTGPKRNGVLLGGEGTWYKLTGPTTVIV